MRHSLSLKLLAVLTLLSAPLATAAPPSISIDPEEEHSLAKEDDTTVVNIRSKRGIGRTSILAKDGQWPKKLVLRLHLKGLEKFEISDGKQSLITSVSSTRQPRRKDPTTYLTKGAGAGRENLDNQIRVDHPFSLNVKLVPGDGAAAKIPLKGYFEIEVPADLLKGKPESLKLHWIDFYRG